MSEFKQNPDAVHDIMRKIGKGKPRDGCLVMAKYCGLCFHSVLHWISMDHIPPGRFADVQAVADHMGIEWSPEDLDDKRVAQRKCLSCQRMFTSEHVGNRICGRCITYREFRESNYAEEYRMVNNEY